MNYKETLFFIAKCLTISLEKKNRQEIEKQLKSMSIDWDNVVKVSTAHYVFPALYCNLNRSNFLRYLPEKLVTYMEYITNLNRERNKKIITQFNGFVRGVDYKDNFYFIAMSKHRYPEKLKGISKNISLDCGIYKFERNTSYCKFYAVHATEAIHSVIIR